MNHFRDAIARLDKEAGQDRYLVVLKQSEVDLLAIGIVAMLDILREIEPTLHQATARSRLGKAVREYEEFYEANDYEEIK